MNDNKYDNSNSFFEKCYKNGSGPRQVVDQGQIFAFLLFTAFSKCFKLQAKSSTAIYCYP
jgi:hypothetical protein